MTTKSHGVTVVDHPLVQHKLTLMRNKDTSTAQFRRLLREISTLLCYEVTRDLSLETVRIETPVAAMERLKERGVTDLRFVCLVASPEGIERLKAYHPDVPVWTAAIDKGLNDHGYIVPGLGDAGDRLFGTR